MKHNQDSSGSLLRLSGWPAQPASTQQMHVKVEHRLPGPGPRVDHQPIAFCDIFLLCHPTSYNEQLAEQIHVSGRDLVHAFDMLVGNKKHMGRRLGVAIVEGGYVLVLVDDAG